MAKVKFVGDKNNPDERIPDEFEAFGFTFEKGKATEVPDHQVGKFSGNSHFEVQGAPETK